MTKNKTRKMKKNLEDDEDFQLEKGVTTVSESERRYSCELTTINK